MSKKKKRRLEFRYYEVPQNEPVLALLGESWKRRYGYDVDFDHFHNLLEVGYCYWGEGRLTVEDEVYKYKGDMFTFIPKNIPHDTYSDVENFWEYLFIDVEQVIYENFGTNPLMTQELIHSINSKASLHKVEGNQGISNIIHSIFEIMRERKNYCTETVRGLIVALLFQIAGVNECLAGKECRLKANSSQLTNALDYISDFFYEPIKIDKLAEVCHMSETHFRRIFKDAMNMTPVEYMNLVRIQMACEYIVKDQVSMELIGERVGYATPSTFNRNFKKYLGVSPYQWKIHPETYEGKLMKYDISAIRGW